MIRLVNESDLCRISEIFIFNNRINYYKIFKDPEFSFKILNVVDVSNDLLNDSLFMNNTYVYLDEKDIIKGFIYVYEGEIRKLYVDPFFQSEGIGKLLIDYAEKFNLKYVWVLEKNLGAQKFYKKHGFSKETDKTFEEGTTEYIIKLERE